MRLLKNDWKVCERDTAYIERVARLFLLNETALKQCHPPDRCGFSHPLCATRPLKQLGTPYLVTARQAQLETRVYFEHGARQRPVNRSHNMEERSSVSVLPRPCQRPSGKSENVGHGYAGSSATRSFVSLAIGHRWWQWVQDHSRRAL